MACQRSRVGSGGTSRCWHRFVRKKESGIARAWKKQQLANLKTRDQTMGSGNGVWGEGHNSGAGHSRACSPPPQRLWFCGILTAGPQLFPGNSPAAQTHSCRRKLGIRVLWVLQQDRGTWDQHHMLPSLFPRWPCLQCMGHSSSLESATEAGGERPCLEDVRGSQTSLTRGLHGQSWRFSNSEALVAPLPV